MLIGQIGVDRMIAADLAVSEDEHDDMMFLTLSTPLLRSVAAYLSQSSPASSFLLEQDIDPGDAATSALYNR